MGCVEDKERGSCKHKDVVLAGLAQGPAETYEWVILAPLLALLGKAIPADACHDNYSVDAMLSTGLDAGSERTDQRRSSTEGAGCSCGLAGG